MARQSPVKETHFPPLNSDATDEAQAQLLRPPPRGAADEAMANANCDARTSWWREALRARRWFRVLFLLVTVAPNFLCPTSSQRRPRPKHVLVTTSRSATEFPTRFPPCIFKIITHWTQPVTVH